MGLKSKMGLNIFLTSSSLRDFSTAVVEVFCVYFFGVFLFYVPPRFVLPTSRFLRFKIAHSTWSTTAV